MGEPILHYSSIGPDGEKPRTVSTKGWYWALDDKWEPYPCKNVIEWAKHFEPGPHVLKHSKIGTKWQILTIFLGFDVTLGKNPKPLIWETMVYDVPGMDRMKMRYATKAEAFRGHAIFLTKVLNVWRDTHRMPPKVKEEKFIIRSEGVK